MTRKSSYYDAEQGKISNDLQELIGKQGWVAMTGRFGVTKVSSDAELISAARSGDPDAYGVLYERHADAARRLACCLMHSKADAEDVVAEAFARVLAALRRGGGPSEAFRPYLLTAARRIAFDQARARRSLIPTDEADLPDPGEPFDDPTIADLDRSLVVRAFTSLPERWSAVLWHTEVERARAADVALLLGITPNGVAALSRRAREGLRQAYLQMHLSGPVRPECRPVVGKLGAHVRGGLSSRDARRVETHLQACTDCAAAFTELRAINDSLRGQLAPVVLGGAAAAYLEHLPHAAGSAATVATSTLRRLIWPRPVLPLAAGVAATAIALPVATVLHHHRSAPHGAVPTASAPGRSAGPVTRAGVDVHSSPAASGPGSSQSPSGPASPSPSATASPSPTGSGTPTPSPLVSGSLTARLGVSVSVSGVLNLGVVVVVTVSVSDPGTAATPGLASSLLLPSGTTVLGLASGGSAGWTCTSGSSGPTSCTHGPVVAGGDATVAFQLLVVSLAGCGHPISDTVTGGSLAATGSSARQVQCLL